MSGTNVIGLGIAVKDNASSRIEAISKRVAEMAAPAERARRAFGRLAESSGLKEFSHIIRDTAHHADAMFNSLARTGGGMGRISALLSTAGLAEGMRMAADFGASIYTASRQAQVSVGSLSNIGNAARNAGGNFDQATAAVVDLNKSLQLAQHGLAPASFNNGLARLFGQDWQAELTKPADQAMNDVLHKLAEMKNPVERDYFGVQLLGSGYEAFRREVQDGTQALDAHIQVAQRMPRLNDEQAKTLTRAQQAMNRLGGDLEGVAEKMMGDYAPAVTELINDLSGWIENNQGLVSVLEAVAAGIAGIGTAWAALRVLNIIRSLAKVTAAFKDLAAAEALAAEAPGAGAAAGAAAGGAAEGAAGGSLLRFAGIGGPGLAAAIAAYIALHPSGTQTEDQERQPVKSPIDGKVRQLVPLAKRHPELIVPSSIPTGLLPTPPIPPPGGPPPLPSLPTPAPPVGPSSYSPDLAMDPIKRALLDTIAQPESGGRYNVRNGGSTFSDYSQFPSGWGLGGKSSASGRYQFVQSTWDRIASALGLKDFSPANQDTAAWYNAATVYYAKTGRDLYADLKAGGHNRDITAALGEKEWPSMPGGSQQQETQAQFDANLSRFTKQEEAGQHLSLDTRGPSANVNLNGGLQVKIAIAGAPSGTRLSSTVSGNVVSGAPRVELLPESGDALA